MGARHLIVTILFLPTLPLAVPAQAGPTVRRVFTSDSLAVSFAQTSPDGNWLVMAVSRGTTSSLWMTPTVGGPLLRLTSEGHGDERPRWFASGDRIVFESNRPSRDGNQQRFLMTLGIDPATGNAIGAPRQVSSEPIRLSGLPSPDGQWMSYVSTGNPAEVKVVPSTGGSARSLGEAGPYPPSFSPDSRHVYFQANCPDEGCNVVAKRAPVAGGPAEVLAKSTGFPIGVITGDPRFTIQGVQSLGPGLGRVDREIIRTIDGREVGVVDLPRGTGASGPTGDGLGIMVRANEFETPIRIVAANGGPIRTLTPGGRNWPEAWMPSGEALITDRPARQVADAWSPANNGIAVELLRLAGGSEKVIPLPAGVGGSGWSSSVGPWFSYMTGNPSALHAINVTTGQTRTITERLVAAGGGTGRGGMEQDGASMVYAENSPDGVAIKSSDPGTGEVRLVRAFPKRLDARARWGYAVHGSRLLYFEARGDSVDLVLTSGPEAAPRRLGTWPRGEVPPDEGAAWSWKGDRLAICGRAGPDHHPILMVLTLPGGSGSIDRQDFDLGTGDVCWAVKWQPDDSGVFLVARSQGSASRADVFHLTLTPGSRPTALTRDEPYQPSEYLPSPDGKLVAYPVYVGKGSSIYVVDLKPLLKLPK